MPISVIDIFAGPGGLGEGFSSVIDSERNRFFDIKLSIEKDTYAHETLELRSFFRQFPIGEVPMEYYELLKITSRKEWLEKRKALFLQYKEQGDIAREEAWNTTLGEVSEKELDKRIHSQIKKDKNWVLIGGPPCQAYSLVGRSRVGGIDNEDHRVYLYREYLRIIAAHKPILFVMENVKGLLSAKIGEERIFDKILSDLRSPSEIFPKQGKGCPDYKIYSLVTLPKDDLFDKESEQPFYESNRNFLIKSELYGIPQKRHRVILVGIRADVAIDKIPILEKAKEVSLSEVIGDLPKLRSGVSREILSVHEGDDGRLKLKYKSIQDTSSNWASIITEHQVGLTQLKEISFLNSKKKIKIPKSDRGKDYLNRKPLYNKNIYREWYEDPKLQGICNHETRAHLKEDLKRYLFAALFAKEKQRTPKLKDYPKDLLPQHKNVESGKFTDRFRVQRAEIAATTVTSHISKDGHYFIHYDPDQCRSLTVREAARIQTFPDNYYFCGPRTAQYVQVGNAVPPLLAFKIGDIVKEILEINKT